VTFIRRRFHNFISESSEPIIDRNVQSTVITLETSVVEVMKHVALPMVFPTAVAADWGEGEVHAVPEEVERRHFEVKRGKNGGEVIEVFDGVHAYSAEWIGVGVAVMERVDVFVEGADVNESVSKVKVNFSPQRNDQRPSHHTNDVLPRRKRFFVRNKIQLVRRINMNKHHFPRRPLNNTKRTIIHIMKQPRRRKKIFCVKFPLRPTQSEEQNIPKQSVPENDEKVNEETVECEGERPRFCRFVVVWKDEVDDDRD